MEKQTREVFVSFCRTSGKRYHVDWSETMNQDTEFFHRHVNSDVAEPHDIEIPNGMDLQEFLRLVTKFTKIKELWQPFHWHQFEKGIEAGIEAANEVVAIKKQFEELRKELKIS